MLPRHHPDRVQITFDDHRLVATAVLILPATLALRLGLPQLLRKHLDLGDAPDRANTGDDCIAAADALRVGRTARVLGFTAKASSTPRFREGRLWAPSCAATGVRRLSTSLWMGRECGSRPHRTHPKTMYEP